jgi:aromatic ring-opening dioxygenase LigB subunit
MNIVFAAISPHPPLLLPSIGSEQDRKKVKKTLNSMQKLREKFKNSEPDSIIISSPHPDWGFNVPLFFIANEFKGKIKTYLMGMEKPDYYFNEGKRLYSQMQNSNSRIALIASGDMSHCLKINGPYGFQDDGPKFDKKLIESLKKKDVKTLLKLEEMYPKAGACGLGSFSFLLGILEESKIKYQPEILSYEAPFGVGYLVANFNT